MSETTRNIPSQEDIRKPWHTPRLEIFGEVGRETEHSTGASNDGSFLS